MPVKDVHEKKSKINSKVPKLGRKMLETIIKMNSCGKESQISMKRCIRISNLPPKYPWIAPTVMPIAEDISVSTKAKNNDSRSPYKIRAKISRPSSSVPSQ